MEDNNQKIILQPDNLVVLKSEKYKHLVAEVDIPTSNTIGTGDIKPQRHLNRTEN